MDTRNKFEQFETHDDFDDLLVESLQISGRPNAKLVAELKHKLRKEEVVMKKSPRRFFSTVAATVAALILLTSSLLAAGWYFGAFERLEEIIGPEQAGILQPMEVGTVFEANGFRAEIVAVGVFYNIVDVYMTLEDLEGSRLDGEMFTAGVGGWHLSQFITVVEDVPETGQDAGRFWGSSGHAPRIIDRCENGVLTMHLRSLFDYEIVDSQLNFHLRDITVTTFFDMNYNTGINLQALVETSPQTMHLTSEMVADSRQMATRWGAADSYIMYHPDDVGEMFPYGLTVLAPHQHNVPIVVTGSDAMYISSIGIVDGRLHVQLYSPDSMFNTPLVTLRDANMDYIPVYKLLAFCGSEDDSAFMWRTRPFGEAIFEIDLDRLDRYHLVAFASAWESFEFYWDVPLVAENHGHIAAQFEIDYTPGRFEFYEVRVNPITVAIYGGRVDLRGQGSGTYDENGRLIPDHPYYHVHSSVNIWPDSCSNDWFGNSVPTPVVRLHTTERVIETTQINYVRPRGSEFYLTFTINGVVDLDTVTAVEINGVMVYF